MRPAPVISIELLCEIKTLSYVSFTNNVENKNRFVISKIYHTLLYVVPKKIHVRLYSCLHTFCIM